MAPLLSADCLHDTDGCIYSIAHCSFSTRDASRLWMTKPQPAPRAKTPRPQTISIDVSDSAIMKAPKSQKEGAQPRKQQIGPLRRPCLFLQVSLPRPPICGEPDSRGSPSPGIDRTGCTYLLLHRRQSELEILPGGRYNQGSPSHSKPCHGKGSPLTPFLYAAAIRNAAIKRYSGSRTSLIATRPASPGEGDT